MTILSPTKNRIGDLIGSTGSKVEIPSYQRSYSWTIDEADDLYKDLIQFSNKHSGTQIEKFPEYFLGAIVGIREGTTLRLLDGQQRLATLTILLSSIRDELQKIQPSAAQQLQSDLIQEQPLPGKPTFTNRLTLSEYDKAYFAQFIQHFPRDHTLTPKKASHKLIEKARDYFDRELAKQLAGKDKNESADYLYRLWTIIKFCLIVVVVETANEDDANEVFEVLNERGVGLSTIDLVRNFILGRADPSQRESIVAAWGEVFSVSDNSTKVQNFLRHYWISRNGDVKSRGLYREIKHKLDLDFKSQISNPYKFSVDLSVAADAYRNLLEPSTDSEQLNAILTTVGKLEATPLYPAILSAFEKHNEVNATLVANALVSHYVRWTVIGRRESTELEKQVFKLAQDIYADLPIVDSITRLRDISLNDEEFQSAFEAASLLKSGQRRPILVALENYLRQISGQGEVEPKSAQVLHVEHLYPQTPLPGAQFDDHEDWVHRIGNLTLLDKRWNSKIKNGEFATQKLPTISQSVLLLNDWVRQQNVWGKDQIDARQKMLAGHAPKVWCFPC